jgi:hypothetical protein
MFTPKQIAALRYLIYKSENSNDLAKRICTFLIEKSNLLTKEVCLTLQENAQGFTAEEISEAAFAFHDMKSSNGSTHVDALIHVLGARLHFDVHYGHFEPHGKFSSEGQFGEKPEAPVSLEHRNDCEMPLRYTFWLAVPFYSKSAEVILVTREELEAFDLERPGLYPGLEQESKLLSSV